MILGALIDAGLPIEALEEALGSLAIDCRVTARRVSRSGIAATKFDVCGDEPADHQARPDGHGEHHSHAHHGHRTLAEIAGLIDRSALSESGKVRAVALFQRLAETEAEIHQMPVDRVHLHEVGALDSIVDIAGAVFGFEWFAADRIVASPLNVGSGTVRTAHGVLPVPAPATARLLVGAPVYSSGLQAELVTPTGALLVTDHASAFGPMPEMSIERVGYGAGYRDFPGVANVLRVIVGESARSPTLETLVVMECEIDDMNPQLFGTLMEPLYEAGALDVFFAPVQMKKNRPGTLLTVLAPPSRREPISGVLFRETTTIGVRFHDVQRERLERESIEVGTPYGPVRFKLARRGGAVVNASPEFEDCAALARKHGLPVKEVQAIALKAYLERADAR
jgi:pyridinium-3,5-bisthiocarboxylic acid mononucleotide nickel chelatase